MMYGQSAETFVGKTSGGRNHYRGFSVPYSASRLLLRPSAAGHHNRYCDNNCRVYCLQDLETQARFQLVEKEGSHG